VVDAIEDNTLWNCPVCLLCLAAESLRDLCRPSFAWDPAEAEGVIDDDEVNDQQAVICANKEGTMFGLLNVECDRFGR
jgi:hypothetical protein